VNAAEVQFATKKTERVGKSVFLTVQKKMVLQTDASVEVTQRVYIHFAKEEEYDEAIDALDYLAMEERKEQAILSIDCSYSTPSNNEISSLSA